MRFTIVFAMITALAGMVAANENAFKIPPGGFKLHDGKSTKFTWDVKNPDEKITLLMYGKGKPSYSGDTLVANHKNTGEFSWTPTDKIQKGENTIEIDNGKNGKNYAEVVYE